MLKFKILKDGPGTPLVFLHGFLGNALDWEPLISHLPESHCIAFDLPGHGDSPFMEEVVIPLKSFHLIGYSMGGRIALQLSKKHPEKIASLTLLSTHPGLCSEKEKHQRNFSDESWAKQLLELPIDEFLKRWYDQPIFKKFMPAKRERQNIPALAKSLLHFSLSRQTRYEIDQVIVGEYDLKFRSLFQNPIIVPEAGHCVHLENPKFVAQIIEQRIFR